MYAFFTVYFAKATINNALIFCQRFNNSNPSRFFIIDKWKPRFSNKSAVSKISYIQFFKYLLEKVGKPAYDILHGWILWNPTLLQILLQDFFSV